MMLVNRTLSRAERLGKEVSQAFPALRLSVEGEIPEGTDYDLLVNGTSVGMRHTGVEDASPVLRDRIVPGSLVYDLIYNPEETVLLKLAREVGARTLGRSADAGVPGYGGLRAVVREKGPGGGDVQGGARSDGE